MSHNQIEDRIFIFGINIHLTNKYYLLSFVLSLFNSQLSVKTLSEGFIIVTAKMSFSNNNNNQDTSFCFLSPPSRLVVC